VQNVKILNSADDKVHTVMTSCLKRCARHAASQNDASCAAATEQTSVVEQFSLVNTIADEGTEIRTQQVQQ
jgi:hypothetical protein